MQSDIKPGEPNFWERNAITLKLVTIGILSVILLIPAAMIEDMIRDREITMNNASSEVTSMWGASQIVAGPVINIPYETEIKNNKGEISVEKNWAHFLPEQLNINGQINPEIRKRGIYEVILYNSNLNIKGSFNTPDINALHIDPNKIKWDEAYLSVGITDLKGIKESVNIKWNGKDHIVSPGAGSNSVFSSGIHTPISLNKDSLSGKYDFSFSLNLNGSKELRFLPLGRETNMSLNSDWANPSFTGVFLPSKRDISAAGFKSEWTVLELNRNFPQQWINTEYQFNMNITDHLFQAYNQNEKAAGFAEDASFGVSLIIPVDIYQKATRSVKYAFLFIALTFVVFFFIEIFTKIKVHPIQYLLVGIALVIFYSLLLSLTEQFGFSAAYIISSIAIIGMIGLYARSILKSSKYMMITMLVLSGLYIFLFTLLQLQDYALLIGNIGLFIILGLVMYFSKKIEWYGKKN